MIILDAGWLISVYQSSGTAFAMLTRRCGVLPLDHLLPVEGTGHPSNWNGGVPTDQSAPRPRNVQVSSEKMSLTCSNRRSTVAWTHVVKELANILAQEVAPIIFSRTVPDHPITISDLRQPGSAPLSLAIGSRSLLLS